MKLRKAAPYVDRSKMSAEEREEFYQAKRQEVLQHPGNAAIYDVRKIKRNENSPLKGKFFIFLGSSVTYGYGGDGVSFADYLKQTDGIEFYKEAVSGTTMVDQNTNGPSFIFRMKTIPQDLSPDAFIVQLSTNDARQNKPMGEIAKGKELKDFDPLTIIGAMEYIIAYAAKTWNCPVYFYTGTKFEDARYQEMIDCLYELKKKWPIEVIDLWNGIDLEAVDDADYDTWMLDVIHPVKAGYLLWWTPYFRKWLIAHANKAIV